MNPDFCFETARLGEVLCEGTAEVTADEVTAFRALMGYSVDGTGAHIAPSSMGLIFGLRLGWEYSIFPPGVVRTGDEDEFGEPARVGDRLCTQFRITDKFERKGRRFMNYEMHTANQFGDMVCAIRFVGMVP